MGQLCCSGVPLATVHWCAGLQVCRWASVPLDGYLLRPMARANASFKEEPFSTDSINKRLQHHLQRLGLFGGESSHGFRRGTVLHDHQQLGRSAEDVGRRLLHVNPGGPQTQQYLDTSMETGRPASPSRRATPARPPWSCPTLRWS